MAKRRTQPATLFDVGEPRDTIEPLRALPPEDAWTDADFQDALVLVVDAPALIYQSFHAIRSLTDPEGRQVNAVYGFTRDMLDLVEKHRPQHLLCAFDHPAPTFRHSLYPDYKRSRAEAPEELEPQFDWIREMLAAMRIQVLEVAGYEADDLLATAARRAHEGGARCWLVTSDKDCRQLITDRVSILHPRKRLLLDAESVIEDWGVRPDQAADFQALVGDSVDDIPGVPLIGPKFASQLLERFGTLAGVLDNIDKVPGPKRQANLRDYRDQALLSRRLVALHSEVPVTIDWPKCRVGPFDRVSIDRCGDQFGFGGLRQRLLKHCDGASNA